LGRPVRGGSHLLGFSETGSHRAIDRTARGLGGVRQCSLMSPEFSEQSLKL
jgi:hypothetical protein